MSAVKVKAQNPWFVDASPQYGFILKHSPELSDAVNSNPVGFSVAVGKLMLKKEQWDRCNCFARSGVQISCFDFQNPSVLGYSANASLFVEPLVFPRKSLHGGVRGVAGFSYVSLVYDEVSNPENLFFSSHLSFFLEIQLSLYYRISQKTLIKAGGTYAHISNGGLKQPNKGMNFPTIFAGCTYDFCVPEFESYKSSIKNQGSKIYFDAMVLYSLKVAKETDLFQEEAKQIFGLSTVMHYSLGKIFAPGSGLEWIHDSYIEEEMLRKGEKLNGDRLAIIIANDFNFGQLVFKTNLGVYLYSPVQSMDPVYQHYGLHYYAFNNVSIGVGLKAHRHVAELMEVCVGYKFNLSGNQ